MSETDLVYMPINLHCHKTFSSAPNGANTLPGNVSSVERAHLIILSEYVKFYV